jgi:hypothetical protein
VTVADGVSSGTADSFVLGIVVALVGWMLVSLWEETLFRGIFLVNAAEGLSARELPTWASVLGAWANSSAVYGVLHGPFGSTPAADSLWYALLMTTVMGGLFGMACVLSGRLAFPIGLHTGINFSEHNLFLSPPGSPVPAVFQVVQTGSGGPVQFQSMGPTVVGPVFLVGYVLVACWFYARRGSVEPLIRGVRNDTDAPHDTL